jgi:hypothetical protein
MLSFNRIFFLRACLIHASKDQLLPCPIAKRGKLVKSAKSNNDRDTIGSFQAIRLEYTKKPEPYKLFNEMGQRQA